ncbi:MAG: PIN domain-containing protein [Ruminococcus sp.]|jgi:predicted nucleic acid-binding protein|nr:PIN domain-containing protein [Ruminococcus sp.]
MDFNEKTSVYLDTSVISHLDHADTKEKYDITHRFWEDVKKDVYDVYISSLVMYEIDKCNTEKRDLLRNYLKEVKYTELNVDEKVLRLADEIVNQGILTKKSYEDCQHIAFAVLNRCDCLLSWNMKHLSTYKTNNGVRKLTLQKDLKTIYIITPTMMLEMGSDYAEDFR